MTTEKEKMISKENYEISKKIYNLFKKYKNFESDTKKVKIVEKYNPDDLFKTRKEKIKTEVAIIEVKEQKWYKKIFMFFRKIFNTK